jgi:hypothetical protein
MTAGSGLAVRGKFEEALRRDRPWVSTKGHPAPEPRAYENDDENSDQWHWVREFDEDDLAEMVNELKGANSREQLVRVLDEWRRTAIAISNPKTRQILLGEFDADSFKEVGRPE